MSQPLILTIYAAVQAEPPRAGLGVTLTRASLTLRRVSQGAGSAGQEQADLMALIRGLEEANKNHPVRLEIHTASQWLIDHLPGGKPPPEDRALSEGLSRARQLLKPLNHCFILQEFPPAHPAVHLARQALNTGPQLNNFLAGQVQFGGTQAPTAQEALQMSAGGVVFKRDGGRLKICLVSKRGGRIWALPKGRVDPGETHQQTAEREVLEETGHRTRAVEKIHEIEYYFFLKETQTLYHKYVFFYLMELLEEDSRARDGEADEVAWFEIGEAHRKLSYLNEKQAVKKAQRVLK
ncbi:MAG: NUDIX domain-containing protein [Candidatus Eremiobacterota bacterium]